MHLSSRDKKLFHHQRPNKHFRSQTTSALKNLYCRMDEMKEPVGPWTQIHPHQWQYYYRCFSNVNKATSFSTEQPHPTCNQEPVRPGLQPLKRMGPPSTAKRKHPNKSNTKKPLKTTFLCPELTPLPWPTEVCSVFKSVLGQVPGAVYLQRHH